MAPNKDFAIKVTGIKEFVGAMKQISTDLPKEMRRSFYSIASDVKALVQSKMASDFKSGSGIAAGTVRVNATPTGATIKEGSSSVSYVPWLDFGGTTGRGHQRGPKQGAIGRYFIHDGRYLYPSLKQKQDVTLQSIEDAIVKVAHEAGVEAHD